MSDVLIVDDHEDICLMIADVLADDGLTSEYVTTGRNCIRAVNEHAPKLVILDLWFKDLDLDGLHVLNLLKENNPNLPVVIISAHGTIEVAVRAMRLGAFDYIVKPIDNASLLRVVKRAIEVARLRYENELLKFRRNERVCMVGSTPAFKSLVATLDQYADKNSRVMLFGQRGTGKRHSAKYMHSTSGRSKEPFVVVNFSAIEPSDADVTIFGKQEDYGKIEPGLIEQAGNGTLYFDEVCDIPVEIQRRLLNAVVHGSFRRDGGEDTVSLNCRIISGTSRSIEVQIAEGKFSEDLYHRMNLVSAQLMPLDERVSDIEDLSNHFVEFFNRDVGLPRRKFHPDTILQMTSLSWPGNIRQLRNLIERILITGPDSGRIVPDETLLPGSESSILGFGGVSQHLISLPLRDAREAFEREYLITQVNRFGGNISNAARFVGMERSALHRKLKGLNVVTKAKSGGRVAVKNI